ncbi:GIN domain-containing protein [Spirosoma arcticum]
MKKTISINISGVIFHIEEDGYDKLKSYLTTVQQYFSTYEDSQEIVTDIENRIAEKLLAKLKSADRQAVSLEDVNELIAAMGTVADFEAVEEEEVLVTSGGRNSAPGSGNARPGGQQTGSTTGAYSSAQSGNTGTYTGPRKLVRDLRRKTLGGVAAGLAHYFNMDVVWVRLIFVALVVGLPALMGASNSNSGDFFGGLSGFTVIIYIAMWIALPGVGTIEEDKTIKKFFRNPEDKVLGGVASGIAAYFGIDTGVVRLLFVLGIVFFGVGFLLYIVLWMIAPPANTLTEKMEMQGRPITLSNIESSIKQNLNINEAPNNESGLTRVLLFPFRAIATIIGGLGSALGPLLNGVVAVIRVFAGILLLVLAFAGMVACLAFLGAAIGLESGMNFGDGDFPAQLFRSDITMPMIVSGFAVGIIPAFGLAILGVMLITTRSVISSRTALTLAGVWLVSMLVFGGTATPLINSFQRKGVVDETKVLRVAGTPTFDLVDIDSEYNTGADLELEGYEGTDLNLVQRFEAQGRNRADAQANARTIQYRYVQRDSVIRFDNSIELAPKARFRMQDLEMNLKIPYEKPFRMTPAFARYIRNRFGEKEIDRMQASLWKFTQADGLVCINFPRERERDADSEDNDVTDLTDDVQSAVAGELGEDFDEMGDHTRQFNASNFSKVDVSGAFVVRFRKGDTYKVVADGREEDLDEVKVDVDGNTLEVSMENNRLFDWSDRKRIGLTITVPAINELKMSGASKASLTGFGSFNDLNIDMSGACRTVFDGDVKKLTIGLSGASNVILRGHATQLDADLTGASKIEATGLAVDRAEVDASGASHADMGQVGTLDSETSGASKVTRQ